jgi:hypothetical protein
VGGRVTPTAQQVVFQPAVVGLAAINFTDRKLGLDETQDMALMLPVDPDARLLDWRDAQPVGVQERDLDTQPPREALFSGGVPSALSSARALTQLGRDLADHLYRNQAFTLLHNPTLKIYAKPGENERDFRARCQQAAREERDKAVDDVRTKYETKLQRLTEQKAKEQQELAEDKAQLQGRVGEEILSGLDSVAGMFGLFGSRRRKSLGGLSRVASKRRMTASAQSDIDESVASIKRMDEDLADLTSDMEAEMTAVTDEWTKAADDIQEAKVTPRKSDIDVRLVTLAWTPSWEVTYQDARGLARTDVVPAFSA